MRKDPIVAEIHKFREAHARKFNYDLDAIFDDLQQKQAKRKNLASLPPIAPALSATPGSKEISLVISMHSPTSTLSLIPELEPVLARGGLKLVVVTLPPEAEAGRQRIARLIQECLGIICCPSVYAPVSTAIANQRPVFVLWQGAGVAMMKALSLSSNVTPVEVEPVAAPAFVPPSEQSPLG